jgi:hypothetical protein
VNVARCLAWVLFGLGTACAESNPAPLSPAPGELAAAPSLDDGGDCADRARVRPLCERAMADRCRSQRSECETRCESAPGDLPANGEKQPTLRADAEEARCRERCSSGYAPCIGSLLQSCPSLCE